MKIFEIIDAETDLLSGILLYYEKARDCIIELPEYLDEWTAPLLFTSFVKRGIYTIPREFSFMWVKERVIPSGRQNIKSILEQHHLKAYDEMKFLEISEGKCSQDSMYIKKIETLPDFVIKRQRKNIIECALLGDYTLLCFFADDEVRKIDLKKLQDVEDMDKVTKNERLYQTGQVGTGGYFVTFNNSIDVPAGVLHEAGEKISLSINDFKMFIQSNILDTTGSCNMLECSRQNISYLVAQGQLPPIREDVRGNLYLKGDVLRTRW
jgi:hypothetical protein